MTRLRQATAIGLLCVSVSGTVLAAPTETVIYSKKDGGIYAGVAADKNGVLYSDLTTKDGGVVYRLRPPRPGKTDWVFSIIHKFGQSPLDAGGISGTLTVDGVGHVFGVTGSGGKFGDGEIFELTPPAPGAADWTETLLYSLNYGANVPVYAVGPMLLAANGSLYGITQYIGGGTCGVTCGAVFRVSPPAVGQTAWSFKTLYTFPGEGKKTWPNPGLVRDASGSLYGTVQYGGISGCNQNNGCGTVFKLTPPGAGQSNWSMSTIYSFTGGADGGNPVGHLAIDRLGYIYGSTTYGGNLKCSYSFIGCGVVFRLSPPAADGAAWTEEPLISFSDLVSGIWPVQGPTLVGNDVLEGTTSFSVFEVVPPSQNQPNWTERVLYDIPESNNHYGTPSGVLKEPSMGIFWTNTVGGAFGSGGVFELKQ